MGNHNSSCFFLRFLLVGHIAKKWLLLPPDQGFEKADGATGALVRKYLASAELEGEQELLKAQMKRSSTLPKVMVGSVIVDAICALSGNGMDMIILMICIEWDWIPRSIQPFLSFPLILP